MDLTLSRRGDYVTRAALCLAREYGKGGYRKIRELVAHTEIPATFAAQILSDLVRAGLAESKAGKAGGYRLTRDPASISILDVVEAAEGPLRPERCALSTGPCRWEEVCPLHETWADVTQELRTILARTTLSEVAARDEAIAAGTYPVPSDSHRSHPTSVVLSDRAHVEMSAADTTVALARLSPELGHLVGTKGAQVSIAPDGSRHRAERGLPALITWRMTDSEGTSTFEGELAVSEVDDQRSELELDGTWRREGSLGGDTPGEVRRRAQLVARTFLRNLARTLEAASLVTR